MSSEIKEVTTLAKGVLRCVSAENIVFFVVKDNDENIPPANIGRPTNGGIRIQDYPDEATAIDEAYSLAKRMTRKNALYNTGFGGVKIVVSACLTDLNKQALMDAIAGVLYTLDGSVYTGCDLNTDEADMRYLTKKSPYVLAGIGSNINPDETTAAGVYGTIMGVVDTTNKIQHSRFLVHGLGKVGFAIAQRLKADGADILSYDILPESAEHTNFQNVSDETEWWTLPFDVLVLCSASNIVTPEIAQQLSCQTIVGSSNKFFSDTQAVSAILKQRGILWIPEIVSSPGAVIADSIEHYAPEVFQHANPDDIYAFISELTFQQTTQLLTEYNQTQTTSMNALLNAVIYREKIEPVCGLCFQPTPVSPIQQTQWS
jgi:leucine dehydrogenase